MWLEQVVRTLGAEIVLDRERNPSEGRQLFASTTRFINAISIRTGTLSCDLQKGMETGIDRLDPGQ